MFGENILIINRWSDELANYDEFIDHHNNKVSYIVNSKGKKGIKAEPSIIGKLFEVKDLNQLDCLTKCALEVVEAFGKIDKIIAASEFDLMPAASLRSKLLVPGIQVNQIRRFKDKVAMKTLVKKAGLLVPNFRECQNWLDTFSFVDKIGYPVILKPKTGAASKGVKLIYNKNQLEQALNNTDLDEYECEEYISGTIFHIDGLVYNRELIFSKASKYINTCLEFNDGTALGSAIVDERSLQKKLVDFTKKVLAALELNNSAFHLEIILKNNREPVFLEIGARNGGGGIPALIKDVYGVGLVEEWVKMELGIFSKLNVINESLVGGFLLVPEPQNTPCKVVRRKQLLGKISTLYKELLPEPGDILDGNGGYSHISGTFLYKGTTSQQIEADIRTTIDLFEIECKKL